MLLCILVVIYDFSQMGQFIDVPIYDVRAYLTNNFWSFGLAIASRNREIEAFLEVNLKYTFFRGPKASTYGTGLGMLGMFGFHLVYHLSLGISIYCLSDTAALILIDYLKWAKGLGSENHFYQITNFHEKSQHCNFGIRSLHPVFF
ncbi:hypothetical protein ACJX0J_007749 [Zea mays]